MVELTYGELKQGLLCCTVYHDCTNCPLYINDDLGPQQDCTYKLMSAAMNCINVMEKDLADTNKRAEMWEDTATKHEKTIIEFHESFDRVKSKSAIEQMSAECYSTTDYAIAMQNLKRCGVIDQDGKLDPIYNCILIKRTRND